MNSKTTLRCIVCIRDCICILRIKRICASTLGVVVMVAAHARNIAITCALAAVQPGVQFLSQCNDGEAQDACAARVAAHFQNKCVQVIPGDAVSVLT
ncbi:unnamed protein product [Trichogramma brassicae]|uniref:Uncharacterized protein n=1 Tax=Trichogramma brassicae TaxID=86971 RepID=A0A6H5I950_9HYME|nr:unnamed protein product [Trichogramma brassicae]